MNARNCFGDSRDEGETSFNPFAWKIGVRALACSVLAFSSVTSASADIRIKFHDPARFTDAVDSFGIRDGQLRTLREVGDILDEYARVYVDPGEVLELTVLDIDLAGIATLSGSRRISDTTPPRFRIAYSLRKGGRLVLAGTDEVADPIFLQTQNPRGSTGGLYYERGILRDWLRRRFARGQDGR